MNKKQLRDILVFTCVCAALFLGSIYAAGMNRTQDDTPSEAPAVVMAAEVAKTSATNSTAETSSGVIKMNSQKNTASSSKTTEAPLKMSSSIDTGTEEKSHKYDDEPVAAPKETAQESAEASESAVEADKDTAAVQTPVAETSANAEKTVSETEQSDSKPSEQKPVETAPVDAVSNATWDFAVPAEPENAKTVLTSLLKSGAFLRWDKTSAGKMYKAYPKLAYAYYDITTGDSYGFNADNVMYSASMIKAPYIWSVLKEIDAFEALEHKRDENGKIIYTEDNKKYDLDEIWIYDPATMKESGSGKIINEQKGFSLTWRELFDYAILYSDNVAFAQIRNRFGYSSFYTEVARLGVTGTASGFMNLTANDCVKFLKEIYAYFDTGTENALRLRGNMVNSNQPEMLSVNFTGTPVAHKYGWDVDAFHDMGIVLAEKPYIIVFMTDYEDGGAEPLEMFRRVCELTKVIHRGSEIAGKN